MDAVRQADRCVHRQGGYDLRRRLADHDDSCTTDPGCRRGIRSARDGSVKYFIPRPNPSEDKVGAEGVAADADGNVFAAENAGKGLRKYARK